MKRCINIDWLELYCLEPLTSKSLDADFFEVNGWHVQRRDYGTRVYKEMFTLYDMRGVPMIEVRRNPTSKISVNGGIFDERSCHLRLTNPYCYVENPVEVFRNFLCRYGYTLVRIFRIDVSLDFTKFDKGDDPMKFIQRYIDGRYSKVNQTNISAHGVDEWNGRRWQSLSWGKYKSMISTKFYCKSIEMAQVKDKPYIRNSWWLAGLIDNPITGEKKQPDGTITIPPVWRVEFSIKSSAKKWYLIERSDTRKASSIAMPHTLDMYDSRMKLEQVFASLAQHYFRFKVFEENKRKDRCKDKVLFDFQYIDTYYKVDAMVSHTPATTKVQRLINNLKQLQEKAIEPEVQKACRVLIENLKRTQINEFAGTSLEADDILILQHVIALQTSKHNDKTLEENIAYIRRMLKDNPDGIF